MNQAVAKVVEHDPVWQSIRQAAQTLAVEEPILGSLVHASVLNQSRFENALAYILAQRLGTEEAPAMLLRQVFDAVLAADPDIGAAARADLAAVYDRDPACQSQLEALLFFKGYHALQTHRMAHALLQQGRRALALHLQGRMALTFGIDINPAARLGRAIMIDHGTGVVIGETAVIGSHVKMYQGVSLVARSLAGGQQLKGKKRHPTVEDHVTIYAGTTIIGGDTVIGAGSTIGANVFLTHSVPPRSLVVYEENSLRIVDKDKDRRGEEWVGDWVI